MVILNIIQQDLINHSCDPNCEVDGVGLKLWIYALKILKKMKN